MSRSSVGIREVLGRDSVHPFPARMAPTIALEALDKLSSGATVLDPMAGSGTVLALARARGHRALGFDVDPLAVLISRVWTRTIDRKEVAHEARKVLESAKKIAQNLKTKNTYPVRSDEETQAFVRYWFDDYSRRQLAALARAIHKVNTEATREVMWCAFSRLIIAKQAGASRAMDLAHSRPHRVFNRAPRKPFRNFVQSVERVLAGCVDKKAPVKGPATFVSVGDVRNLRIAKGSVDLVFTSPPYLNAIDYLRCSKFSLVWMGYQIEALREIRSESIGAEVRAESLTNQQDAIDHLKLHPTLAPRMNEILRRYAEDTARSLAEVVRVLSPSGRAVYVVGENTIRQTYVRTGDLVAFLAAKAGLRLVDRHFRYLPGNRRYLPPPGAGKHNLDARMRREVILTFGRARRKMSSN